MKRIIYNHFYSSVTYALLLFDYHDYSINIDKIWYSTERSTNLFRNYVSGITISADRVLYFADGTAIRFVDNVGIIRTIVGRPANPVFGLQPAPCNMAVKPDQVRSTFTIIYSCY